MESKSKIRFGVIGCGHHARKSFIPALKICQHTELVAIASRTYEAAKECAALFECESVTGYSEILLRDDIDAIYIGTPIGLHSKWILQAVMAGKHVLCEKTLAASLEETIQAVNASKSNDVALMEGFAYQYHTQHTMFKELIEQGAIGEPHLYQAWFGFPPPGSRHRYEPLLGGGALLDAGTYTVHGARKYYSSEPIRIHASLNNEGHRVDVHGSVLMEFQDGKTALLAFGFDNMYRNAYSVWGSEGLATLTRAFSTPPDYTPSIILEKQNYRKEIHLQPYNHFVGELNEFVMGIADVNLRNHWCDDALLQAKAIDAIRESALNRSSLLQT